MNIPNDWTFKTSAVAGEFDKHVREQLPWYDLVTGAVAHFARHYIPHGGRVYDIGASTGNIGKALAEVIEKRNVEFIALDNSEAMKAIYGGPGTFVVGDILDVELQKADMIICFLCLMFVPVAHRADTIRRMIDALKPGGALIIFDKCAPQDGYFSTVMSRLALAGKLAAGVAPAEIIAKELSLSGIQRPLTPSEIPVQAHEIFRFGDFAGWIIEAK